jgi:hypothetical protein
MDKKQNKIHFAKVQRFSHKRLSYKEKAQGKYVKSGNDNLFPQHLISLYNDSSIHAAAVNATVEAIIGGGLVADIESALDRANTTETWNDIYTKISMDFYLHGSFALEIIWSLDRSRIAEVNHIDFSMVRAKEKDNRGKIPGYFISNEWSRYGSVKEEDIEYLPVYNPLKKQEEPSQIYVAKFYRPGQEYYPLPTYNGALKVVELDASVDDFHTNNIQNGLAPSLAITTFMNGSDDDVRAIEQGLRANYGGTQNAGSLIYLDVDSPENAPKIEPIPQNGADNYYTTINDVTTQKILTGHRITSPMMLGIKTEGQLGGRDEVVDAFLLWFNTVIEPLQQDILRCLDMLLDVNYPGITIGVNTKKLYEDGEEEEEVVTSVETEVQDEENLNDEINDNNLSNIGG